MRIFSLLLSGLIALVSSTAFAQTAVRFALDWRFEGPATPYFVAIDKGYYKAEGLDVTIDPGASSVEPINRVASGVYQMGFADINSLIKFRDNPQNSPVRAVMMAYDTPAFSIVTLKGKGISKPKDLEGKILGAPAPDGAYAQWPIFVDANKIDASKVRIENVGFPVREPRNAIANRDVELQRLKMALDKNYVTPDVLKSGLGNVDMKRLEKSIDQIGLTFKFTNKPKAADIFTSQFLPARDQRLAK